jgi:cytoskeletal protein CcmA (bactofilin family)
MASRPKGSVRISGSGSAAGGVYDEVSISGSGTVTGDVEAGRIEISGSGKIEGNVKAASFESSGASKVDGALDIEEGKCSGASTIVGDVKAEKFSASGAVHVGGDLRGGQVEVSGAGEFGGDVEAEQFRSRGSFEIDGLLNADKVGIALGGDARAREIGGGEIVVVRRSVGAGLFGWGVGSGTLKAKTVEGDDVYLEGTHADVVRGRSVRIGPGSRIGNVEYSESLAIDPEAEVRQHAYTGSGEPPPPTDAPVERPSGWARKAPGGGRPKWAITVFGRDVRNPVARFLAAAFGVVIAAVVIGVVAFIVLPAVGFIVALVLGGVALLLLLIAVGMPVLAVGAGLVELLRLPFGAARRRMQRRN